MFLLAIVHLIAAALLGISGTYKTVVPQAASRSMARLGLYHRTWAVRVLGVVELVVAVGAFVLGGSLAAIGLALFYGGFSVVAMVMVRSESAEPCGCFGRVGAPMTWRHVMVNITACLVGTVASIRPVEAFDRLLDSHQPSMALFAAGVAAGTLVVFSWLTRPRHPPGVRS